MLFFIKLLQIHYFIKYMYTELDLVFLHATLYIKQCRIMNYTNFYKTIKWIFKWSHRKNMGDFMLLERGILIVVKHAF